MATHLYLRIICKYMEQILHILDGLELVHIINRGLVLFGHLSAKGAKNKKKNKASPRLWMMGEFAPDHFRLVGDLGHVFVTEDAGDDQTLAEVIKSVRDHRDG